MTQSNVWAVVPAAGVGSRMQSVHPKQYLPFLHHTVIEHSLQMLCSAVNLQGVVVSVSEDDTFFSSLRLDLDGCPVYTAVGGVDRAASVFNGLRKLQALGAQPSDWVLVHDAARPCVQKKPIELLMMSCMSMDSTEVVGAILAVPVADTLKRALPSLPKDGEGSHCSVIANTVEREHLWQAHTPQCFRLAHLIAALQSAEDSGITITDEASAIESLGGRVLLVEDSRQNIKITRPDDLALAEFIAKNQLS